MILYPHKIRTPAHCQTSRFSLYIASKKRNKLTTLRNKKGQKIPSIIEAIYSFLQLFFFSLKKFHFDILKLFFYLCRLCFDRIKHKKKYMGEKVSNNKSKSQRKENFRISSEDVSVLLRTQKKSCIDALAMSKQITRRQRRKRKRDCEMK